MGGKAPAHRELRNSSNRRHLQKLNRPTASLENGPKNFSQLLTPFLEKTECNHDCNWACVDSSNSRFILSLGNLLLCRDSTFFAISTQEFVLKNFFSLGRDAEQKPMFE